MLTTAALELAQLQAEGFCTTDWRSGLSAIDPDAKESQRRLSISVQSWSTTIEYVAVFRKPDDVIISDVFRLMSVSSDLE